MRKRCKRLLTVLRFVMDSLDLFTNYRAGRRKLDRLPRNSTKKSELTVQEFD